MIWVFCKQCERWHRIYPTTVMRCPYCGSDVTEWEGWWSGNERVYYQD